MNAKRCVIVLFIMAATINVLNRYFFTPDFQWNPFNSKYTQISFKSVLISSQVNLIIFISKPILSDIMRYCKNRIRGVRYKSGNIVTENFNCYRSATIYKRPHVKWYIIKPSIDDSDDDINTDHESIQIVDTVEIAQNVASISSASS